MLEMLPVSDAADVLGVNRSRVRALIASGTLDAEKVGGVWLVDRTSVARRNRGQASAGRPFSPANAWALLFAASGEELPLGLGPSERWRVRRALESYGLNALRPRLARRAEPATYWALPGELRALRDRDGLVLSGASAAAVHDLGLVGANAIDAYVPARLALSLRREHALEAMSGPESNVILRVVPDDAWLLDGRRFAPLAKVAVDLATYADPRAARVGAEVIARIDRDAKVS
jgi:excisionase family DNA binding protein